MFHALRRRRPADPAVAQTAALLTEDINALRRVASKGTVWSAAAVEGAHHRVYSATGPWLGLARSRRSNTDSPADRARWDAWVTTLSPPERSVIRSYADLFVLVGRARDMLRVLRETLPPCPSVGSVAKEIERLVQAGELAPAARIPRGKLAKGLEVPVEHVDLALTDLAVRGLVEVRVTGTAVVVGAVPDVGGPELVSGRQQITVVDGAGAEAA